MILKVTKVTKSKNAKYLWTVTLLATWTLGFLTGSRTICSHSNAKGKDKPKVGQTIEVKRISTYTQHWTDEDGKDCSAEWLSNPE